jgi:hypothetical protein
MPPMDDQYRNLCAHNSGRLPTCHLVIPNSTQLPLQPSTSSSVPCLTECKKQLRYMTDQASDLQINYKHHTDKMLHCCLASKHFKRQRGVGLESLTSDPIRRRSSIYIGAVVRRSHKLPQSPPWVAQFHRAWSPPRIPRRATHAVFAHTFCPARRTQSPFTQQVILHPCSLELLCATNSCVPRRCISH